MPKPSVATSATLHRHIVVFAFPFATHAGLLFGFTRRLAATLPDVTFSFFSTSKSNMSLFSDSGTPENVTAHDISDGVPEGYEFSGQVMEDIELFMKVAPEEFRRGAETTEAVTGKRVTCILADAFLWFTSEMAEEMGVAWVPLWTSGACSLSTHFYTDLIRQTVGSSDIKGREDEIVTFIPGFPSLRLGDLQSGVLFGNLNSPFSNMLHKMGQVLPKATVVPINSFKELDPEINKDLSTKFKLFLNVGPFNLTAPRVADSGDHYCLQWLDRQNPNSVAYIGFGTVAVPPPHELVALAEALEESGTHFIWSLRDNLKVYLPHGFLERTSEIGKIVPWAPQVQILEHVSTGVVITHCGWNSVLECIAAGVPMIGRPFFGDHQINTWMVEKVWEIGVRVEGGVFTKKGLICALEEILLKEKGKKLKENITIYKELALKAVGPNGSSTQDFKSLLEVITSDNF